MRRKPELLAPAGDWDCLRAAVANGADAVFFGIEKLNARMRAENFELAGVGEVVRFLHARGVKAYTTLNVLVFPRELDGAVTVLQELDRAGVDAVILQDVGLVDLARRAAPGLRVHASTQMTITSPEGVAFAESLGVKQVVLARELSLRELEKFPPSVPLEMFVHGALCVAYSGQCLTSEALGRRSANRGECAQACRMPYEIVVDGVIRDLGDRRYLLSPQDLAAVNDLPALIERGVQSLKIEGRLKSPEYVAAVTSVYRKALDAAWDGRPQPLAAEDAYTLEMAFSRGLGPGWLHGVNHQELVGARYAKKRGAFLGHVLRTAPDALWIEVAQGVRIQPGDGIVIDTGGDTDREQGGRVARVDGPWISFEPGRIDTSMVPRQARVWKTSDPALDRRLRATFQGRLEPRGERLRKIDLRVSGRAGEPLLLSCCGLSVRSGAVLQNARSRPMNTDSLRAQLGKLGGTPYVLGDLEVSLEGDLMLPLSEINALRRALVAALDQRPSASTTIDWRSDLPVPRSDPSRRESRLTVLVRTMEQLDAALRSGVAEVIVDFEDIRRAKDAVAAVRVCGGVPVFLATPRIQKAGEDGVFRLLEKAGADGLLLRNLGSVVFFRDSALRKIGDFSLNVANAASAAVFQQHGLERLTVSHDLNARQVVDLLGSAPAEWFEVVLHHHMPMFHMEHCVFAAFLSDGKDFLSCGRPCESHRVELRDRVGMKHPLRADVGCRNTLFHAKAQSGARFLPDFLSAGARVFRIELLAETAVETASILRTYQNLLAGRLDGAALHRVLKTTDQMGVTTGTYEEVRRR